MKAPVILHRGNRAKSKSSCEACQGNGFLYFPADNTVQRCDECEMYKGDLQAAIAFFEANPKARLKDITLVKDSIIQTRQS